jgi:hypothetical protein
LSNSLSPQAYGRDTNADLPDNIAVDCAMSHGYGWLNRVERISENYRAMAIFKGTFAVNFGLPDLIGLVKPSRGGLNGAAPKR